VTIETIRVVAVTPDARRSVAWVSVADTGDVSAELTDRNIVIADPGGERDGSRNPHFTFHPPIYHHLRANGEPEVLAGLMEVGIMLHEMNVVPWIRLVSRPYEHLTTTQDNRKGTGVLGFEITNLQLSAQVELDFVRGGSQLTQEPGFMYRQVTPEISLRLGVQSCPPSPTSLTLLWQG
jgi:hypothetical protein